MLEVSGSTDNESKGDHTVSQEIERTPHFHSVLQIRGDNLEQ